MVEAGPQPSSVLGLNWNEDNESLIVRRGTEQEVQAKITHKINLAFVSTVFDSRRICSIFTTRMQFLLIGISAEMGQARDN